MTNWTIGRRLFTGVGALIALIIAVAILSLWVGRSLEQRLVNTDDHIVRRLETVHQVETELERLYATQPALIMAGYMNDRNLIEAQKRATAEGFSQVTASIQSFRREAASDADRPAMADLASELDAWKRANDEVTKLV